MCLWPAAVLGNHREAAASTPRLTFLVTGLLSARAEREGLEYLLFGKLTHEPQNSPGPQQPAGGCGQLTTVSGVGGAATISGKRPQFETGLAKPLERTPGPCGTTLGFCCM